MKFWNITLLFVIFALACTLTFAEEEAPAGKRPAPRRPIGKSAKTTTSAPPPAEEGDYGDEGDNQYGDEGEEGDSASSTTTTSTEPPKKVGPIIRPFRSNDDFLNSLKQRQLNAKKHRSEHPTPKSKPAPAADDDDESDDESAPAPVPAKSFKGNPALNRRKPGKAGKAEQAAEEPSSAAEESEDKETKRPHPRLTLRKRI